MSAEDGDDGDVDDGDGTKSAEDDNNGDAGTGVRTKDANSEISSKKG